MKKIGILLNILFVLFTHHVNAELARDVYSKLLTDCKELKGKNLISVNCDKLNNRELKNVIENGLYEIKVKNVELEYTSILNNLNVATVYGDYADICENLKEKVKKEEYGYKCDLPKDCYSTDIETIKETTTECLNIVTPLTRNCSVWFTPDISVTMWDVFDRNGNKTGKYEKGPYYTMRLNTKSLNSLFFKRMVPDGVDYPSLIAAMSRCGYINSDIDKDGNFYKFPKRPIVSVWGYSVSNILDNLSGNKYATALKRNGFEDGRDFLNWVQGCFFEVLGDKVSNLKYNEKTGCWY